MSQQESTRVPPHVIRLGGPWTREPVAHERVRCQRRFGRPTNLDRNERIDLVLCGINGNATVMLNGCCLGELRHNQKAGRFEVTNLLAARNELCIEVDSPLGDEAATGGMVGEVQLEIYEVTR